MALHDEDRLVHMVVSLTWNVRNKAYYRLLSVSQQMLAGDEDIFYAMRPAACAEAF